MSDPLVAKCLSSLLAGKTMIVRVSDGRRLLMTTGVDSDDDSKELFVVAMEGTGMHVFKRDEEPEVFDKCTYRDWETDRKSTRLNSSHITRSRMPSSA